MNRFARIASANFLAVGAVALALAGGANAATTSGTLAVSATVTSSCTVSGTALNFGASINSIAGGPTLDGSGSLSVKCSNTTPYSIALDAGLNGTDANSRKIKNGTNVLPYQLYSDATHAVVWSSTGAPAGGPVTGTGTGSSAVLNVYGTLSNLSAAVPGTYSDTVTVTVTY